MTLTDASTRLKSCSWFSWATLLLTVAIAAMWVAVTPVCADDFFYRRMPGPDEATGLWRADGDFITSFVQVPQAIANHRADVNGRGANLAFLAVQPLPPGLVKVLCGLVLALVAVMLWRWATPAVGRNDWLALAVPLLMWSGLQWNDYLMASAFQFNYTLSSALLIGCILLFWHREGLPPWWAWIVLAVLSLWHDCFSAALGMVLAVRWIFVRSPYLLAAIALLLAGTLLQMSSGSLSRMSIVATSPASYSWSVLLFKSWVSVAAFALWPFARSLAKASRRQIDCFGWGLAASWLLAIAMIVFIKPPQRAHWPNDLLAVMFILLMLRCAAPCRFITSARAALVAAYALWGVSLVGWQLRVTAFYDYLTAELASGKNVIVDKEGFAERKVPFWLMGMVQQPYQPSNYWEIYSMAFCNFPGHSDGFVILPASLADKPFEQWPTVPGDTTLRFTSNNVAVRRHDGTDLTAAQIKATFGSPNIAVAPVDLALAAVMGQMGETAREVGLQRVLTIEAGTDSLDILILQPLTRTLLSRPLTNISR